MIWLAALVVGGLAPAAWWWAHMSRLDAVRIGPWQTSLAAGASDADWRTRAYVAVTALLALNRSETLYFVAEADDEGRKLEAECAYDITGGALPARWWSLTAYAGDNFLIANAPNRYAFNMKTVNPAADGRFSIAVGPKERAGNWLPSGEAGKGLNFLIRLYNPEAQFAADPRRIPMPSIRRTGAC